MLSGLGLVELTFDEKTGAIATTTNMTILNVFLLRLGPMREDSLTRVLISTQASGVSLCFPTAWDGIGRDGGWALEKSNALVAFPRVLLRGVALRAIRTRETGRR